MELPKSLLRELTREGGADARPTRTVTGTAKLYEGAYYVQLDGSDQLTPIRSSTAGMRDGDRVTVEIADHSARVTGNVSRPSASQSDVDDARKEVGDQITEVEILVADKASTKELDAERARIDELVAESVTIKGDLVATNARIDEIDAGTVTAEDLEAVNAKIDDLDATKLDAEVADLTYATVGELDATNATIHNLSGDYATFKQTTTDSLRAQQADIGELDAGKLDADEAELRYANIDFSNIGEAAVEALFAKSGIIEDLVVSGGHVTGMLVGVTIRGDRIEGGTVVADKLVVKGEDGLFYKLNASGETVAAQQTDENSLSGTVITAKSITAEKVAVDDLVAFGATIGGYHIGSGSLHSGVKESATNATRGVFLGSDGQFAVGDSDNYLRFVNDEGIWRLEVCSQAIRMSADGQTVGEALDAAESAAASAQDVASAAQSSATEALERAVAVESNLEQTAEGWTYEMDAVRKDVSSANDRIDSANESIDGIRADVDSTGETVKDITSYVRIQQEDGKPVLTLGTTDSEFQVRITNESLDFLQGTQRVAYMTNKKLYIQASTVTDELQIGNLPGYIWRRRANNHLGLRYYTK